MKEGKQVDKYIAVTQGDESLEVRTSYANVLPAQWENPNFLELLKMIEEKG